MGETSSLVLLHLEGDQVILPLLVRPRHRLGELLQVVQEGTVEEYNRCRISLDRWVWEEVRQEERRQEE